MNCQIMQIVNLQFIEGNIRQFQYEFANEIQQWNTKKNAEYFLIDLDSLLPQQNGNDKLEYKQKGKQNIIGGLLLDDLENVAEKMKEFIINNLKQNIYLSNKQFEDAFKNICIAISDFLHSAESTKICDNKNAEYQYQAPFHFSTVNLMMIVDDRILLSKSFSSRKEMQNKWCIKLENKYRDINKDDLIDVSPQHYEIKKEIAEGMNEIILTCSESLTQDITGDVRTRYPTMIEYFRKMVFLKIKNLYREINIESIDNQITN